METKADLTGMATERLIVEPVASAPGRFKASLESTGSVIVESSRQPLVDGARELLKAGFCPTDPLTMRHLGAGYDSFLPAPIGELAKWSYEEGRRGLAKTRWMPFAGRAGRRTDDFDTGGRETYPNL
jgi:hypothetical protein